MSAARRTPEDAGSSEAKGRAVCFVPSETPKTLISNGMLSNKRGRVHLRQSRRSLTESVMAGCKVRAVDPTSKERLNDKIGLVGDFDAKAGLFTVIFDSKEVKMRPGELSIFGFPNEKAEIEDLTQALRPESGMHMQVIFRGASRTSGWTRKKSQSGPLAGKCPHSVHINMVRPDALPIHTSRLQVSWTAV